MTFLRRLSLLALSAVVFLVPGCVKSPSAPELSQLTAPSEAICRVAVLPFVNHTEYARGDLIVYRIFVAELNRLGGFSVVQEGDIRKIFRQMKLSPKETPGYEQTLVLADRLAVDAVITGEIITMREERGKQETAPELAVEMKLVPAGSTKPWLTTYHRRRGDDYRQVMHFGLVNTMTALTALLSDEILQLWFSKGLTPCAS